MNNFNQIIVANGFETLDGCLHRHDISTALIEVVLMHEQNRQLASLPIILPAQTKIYVPDQAPKTKEIKQLWD